MSYYTILYHPCKQKIFEFFFNAGNTARFLRENRLFHTQKRKGAVRTAPLLFSFVPKYASRLRRRGFT